MTTTPAGAAPAGPAPVGWVPGDRPYVRITVGLFAAGFATFALVYCPQPLLPVLADEFALTPAIAALSLSVTTVSLGLALLFFGPLSDAVGRLALLRASLLVSALLALATAYASGWGLLLGLRAALGFALAGLPAVAAAYLHEEVHPDWSASATGLYIGGTAVGGMSGRLLTGLLSDWFGWRVAFGSLGVLALLIAVVLRFWLPPARRFRPTPLNHRALAANARRMLLDRGLLTLYGVGFFSMGAFVACFNGLAFRLVAPPFALSVGAASLVFATYVVGSVSSPVAGRLASRFGARRVVPVALAVFGAGAALTLVESLAAIAVGVGLITLGFFAAHATTSAWVTARASARGRGTGMAGALYLAAYYFGASVWGALAGTAWARGGWPGVAALVGGLVGVALVLAASMRGVASTRVGATS